MKNTKDLMEIAARSIVPVLLQGESGVGKEVAARFIHTHGRQKNGPFIALNCSSIPQNLAESILEGSVKGAFTGATEERKGMVRASDSGTLFLDEIGELPLEMQGKLLRILQEKAVLPIGATKSVSVNFRLICATNRNLKQEILSKKFREDLFFRINVFPIEIPPLRLREDFSDIAKNIWFDSRNLSDINPTEASSLSSNEINLLKKYDWPGNIRQLKNVLERYTILKPYNISLREILNDEFNVPFIQDKNLCPLYSSKENKRKKNNLDITLIKDTLEEMHGNKCKAAQKLGISRGSLCYQLKKENYNRWNYTPN